MVVAAQLHEACMRYRDPLQSNVVILAWTRGLLCRWWQRCLVVVLVVLWCIDRLLSAVVQSPTHATCLQTRRAPSHGIGIGIGDFIFIPSALA